MYAASLENDDRESCVQMNVDDIASLKNYFLILKLVIRKNRENSYDGRLRVAKRLSYLEIFI